MHSYTTSRPATGLHRSQFWRMPEIHHRCYIVFISLVFLLSAFSMRPFAVPFKNIHSAGSTHVDAFFFGRNSIHTRACELRYMRILLAVAQLAIPFVLISRKYRSSSLSFARQDYCGQRINQKENKHWLVVPLFMRVK